MNHLMRQILLIIQLVCGLAVFGADSPNVILIMTDDQGYGDISSHGNALIDTPNLDQLAEEGARFQNFFVSPLCAPTRASLLTGRYHIRTGTVNVSNNLEIMRSEETTVAELFKANGYETGLFGKCHNGEHYPNNPNGQGFDEFVGFCAGHFGNYFDPVLEHNSGRIETEGFITDVLTEKAMEWIEANQDKPFFCYIPYNAPHTPYQVPDAYYDKYAARGFDVKPATIYGMVENIDDNIGRLLRKVTALGLKENTIIIFMTDNGPNGSRYNAGMKGIKGSVDEGGVRVPLFVRWPGHVKGGTVVDDLAAHIDLMPTLMDLCGVNVPSALKLDGLSLKPLLLDQEEDLDDRIIFTHRYRGHDPQLAPQNGAARSSRFRYVLTQGEESLYDMVNDPEQKKNIKMNLPEAFERMRTAYSAWFSDVTEGWEIESVIPFGYSEFPITHLNAVQGKLSGDLKFHGRGFNHDWIINWINPEDSIKWDIDVVQAGRYRIAVKYVCPEKDIGSRIRVNVGGDTLKAVVDKAFDPEIYPAFDRAPRNGELEKPWATLEIGNVELEKGNTSLILSADCMPGGQIMEVRMVILERIGGG